MADAKPILIYGANGYTGKLIAAVAKERGHTPILAGRHPQKITDLAMALRLPARIFDLAKEGEARRYLEDVGVVIHCAGPFSRTAQPMLGHCLATKTHYLDITGEIDVFEMVHRRSAEIAKAGIIAVPGVGFDVVPTDCLAARLKERLPDADHLALAFDGRTASLSVGTAKTSIEGLGEGGRVRTAGRIVATGSPRTRDVPFETGVARAIAIPWGDVSTAFHSTGIPNIEVFMGTTEARIRAARLAYRLRKLLALRPVQLFMQKQVEKRMAPKGGGPRAETRARATVSLWGEATNPAGRKVELWMRTPEGYTLTAESAVRAAERVLSGSVAPGAWTPSRAFGAGFAEELPGVSLRETPPKV